MASVGVRTISAPKARRTSLPKNNQVFAVERSNESNQPEFPKNCQDNANCKLSHAMKNELLAGVILYGHGHIWQKKNL